MVNEVWRIAEPVVMHEGMEIVDIELRREARGKVLRFYLDRDGGVSLEDLAPLSRRLSNLLDVHDVVPGAYTLEISSPGINRRLRNPAHFRRYLDKKVRVRCLEPLDGRRSFLGLLRAVENDGIVVEVEQRPQFIPFAAIEQANYEHVFEDQVRIKPGRRSESR
ncbi:MAG TPA: ribosome maturation factor RimP [Candidatus Binatia bacterium]|nr:ribosome maturation factor RimP [Candidatus Binatia bacterium]